MKGSYIDGNIFKNYGYKAQISPKYKYFWFLDHMAARAGTKKQGTKFVTKESGVNFSFLFWQYYIFDVH